MNSVSCGMEIFSRHWCSIITGSLVWVNNGHEDVDQKPGKWRHLLRVAAAGKVTNVLFFHGFGLYNFPINSSKDSKNLLLSVCGAKVVIDTVIRIR